jgi:hypothetical protein
MPKHKLTDLEQLILTQLGRINYGKPGRPSNNKKKLLIQLAAIDALLRKNQRSKESQQTKERTDARSF